MKIQEGCSERGGEKKQETAANIQEKAPVNRHSHEKFQDFDYVRSFYTVDKTTSMSSEQLNAPELVQMDMRMQAGKDQPQILIYHSHSQEEFIDSIPGKSVYFYCGRWCVSHFTFKRYISL